MSLVALKKGLLATYTLIHVQSFASCATGLSTWAEMVGLPKDSCSDSDEKSTRQNHMLGCLKGFNLGMLYLCGMVWYSGDPKARDQIILAEAILFAVTGYDAIQLGITKFLVAYLVPPILSGLAVLGPGMMSKIKSSK